ncbi:MAG: lipid-binding SYLF domain-containing protein [Verrucomicrobiota bacterium]|nr:lipid-binding SYLF domain-containing protein [Verrucomicrobiota bacterium]
MTKPILLVLALLGCAGQALALDRTQLDDRIRLLTAKFEALQRSPDQRVPADLLRQARGVVLLDRFKAGFLFAFQGGGGVALVRDKSGHWSPAAFLTANEASLGFQVGGERNFCVILLMTTRATEALTGSTSNFGGEARGTAGNQSSGVEGKFTDSGQAALIFEDRNGFYGGVSIKGGTLSPDNRANEIYYGRYVSVRDILFGRKVASTPAEIELARQLSAFSKE